MLLVVLSLAALLALQELPGPSLGGRGGTVQEAQTTQASYSYEKAVPMTQARAMLCRLLSSGLRGMAGPGCVLVWSDCPVYFLLSLPSPWLTW